MLTHTEASAVRGHMLTSTDDKCGHLGSEGTELDVVSGEMT